MSIGEKIRTVRLEKEIPVTELAVRTGVPPSTIHSIEQESHNTPSLYFLNKISDGLEVPLADLLEGHQYKTGQLDDEWTTLALDLIDAGVTKSQFQDFLQSRRPRLVQ